MRFRILWFVLLGCGRSLVAQPNDKTFVDSVLAVPYDALVGDLNTSYTTLHRALNAARGTRDRIAEGKVRGKPAVVHHLRDQLDPATFYGLRSVDIFRGMGAPVLLGEALCGGRPQHQAHRPAAGVHLLPPRAADAGKGTG